MRSALLMFLLASGCEMQPGQPSQPDAKPGPTPSPVPDHAIVTKLADKGFSGYFYEIDDIKHGVVCYVYDNKYSLMWCTRGSEAKFSPNKEE